MDISSRKKARVVCMIIQIIISVVCYYYRYTAAGLWIGIITLVNLGATMYAFNVLCNAHPVVIKDKTYYYYECE